MKVEELIKETKLSYYGRATYNKSLCDISLYDWIFKYPSKYKNIITKIREINLHDEKSAKKMKGDNLCCVTLTGHFPEYRNISQADRLNPIICIDIDRDGNDITDWEKVKKDVISLDYVFYASLSCRGEGVFCYVYWDTSKDFNKVWNALERDFKEKFNITIDKNCKDITRLRFVSYDYNTLIKKEVEVYSDEYIKEVCDEYKESNETLLKEDDYFTFKAILHLIKDCNYRANTYYDWLQDGFRLATFGDNGKLLFMCLSQLSDNYDEETALNKFRECVRTTKKSKSSLAYYFARLKDYYGDNWKNIINKD